MAFLPDFFRSSETHNPFREFSRLQREVDRALDTIYDRPRSPGSLTPTTSLWAPACEIRETDQAYEVRAEMPGMKKDEIKIELEENRITLSAERKEEKHDDKKHLSEFNYGSYLRSFTLPTAVDTERSAAQYENGVLSVSLTKLAPAASKNRRIRVK